MSSDIQDAKTLGEIIAIKNNSKRRLIISTVSIIAVFAILAGLFLMHPTPTTALVFLGTAIVICFLTWSGRLPKKRKSFLLSNDKQGFMRSLVLSQKNALIDGSNVYHFGLENGFGPNVLRRLTEELRAENFRIVCFFDANIYFRLLENDEFEKSDRSFSVSILRGIFGLDPSEIYVVPKGEQADLFIVESLSHLPTSFAVTNDRFRDYESQYDFLGKDQQWRKGVKIERGELKLSQYKFKEPIRVE